jgi:hypothetical protein
MAATADNSSPSNVEVKPLHGVVLNEAQTQLHLLYLRLFRAPDFIGMCLVVSEATNAETGDFHAARSFLLSYF